MSHSGSLLRIDIMWDLLCVLVTQCLTFLFHSVTPFHCWRRNMNSEMNSSTTSNSISESFV